MSKVPLKYTHQKTQKRRNLKATNKNQECYDVHEDVLDDMINNV